MKRKSLLFALLVALFMPWAANAQETVTVCDGTTTNSKIPVNGLYTDTQGTTSEFIIPAETEGMSDMEGGTISKVTFYISEIPGTWGSPVIQLYLGEVEGTTLSSLYGPSNFTVVKTMVWSNQQSTIEVEFDEPYTYEGGNLLIGTYVQTSSSYKTTNFYGVTGETGCSRYNNGSGTGTSQNFLPKTTFTYEPASNDCPQPATLVVSDMTSTTATVTWTMEEGVEADHFEIQYKPAVAPATSWTSRTVVGYHEFTFDNLIPGYEYNARVRVYCGVQDGYSAWRYAENFTTPITCPVPTLGEAEDITAEGASFQWTENGSATQWVLEYSTDVHFTNSTTINCSGNPAYTITGLDAATTYYVDVKSVCGVGDESDWSYVVSFTTTAVATVVGNAWSDDFEGTSCGWELINGTITNAWAWGTATNNGGTHALYVSNDGGTTNAYSNGSAAMVYATKLLTFADGKYEFSYDWNGNGESTYDYLRVALVPASVTLTASTSYPTGFGTTSLPTGWIALDGGGKLNLATAWQSMNATVNVTAGNYYLVMAWRDDTSGGTNPPAAVDNVSITKVTCDQDVTNLAVSEITTNSAILSWNGGEATQWQVAYGTASNFEGATEEIVSTASYNMSGLQSSSTYFVKVRAYCGGEDFGSWSDVLSFNTACDAITTFPWSEDFESYSAGNFNALCWVNEHISGSGTQIFKVYTSSNGNNSTHQLQLPDMSSGTMTKLMLPVMTLPGDDYLFSIDVYRNATSYAEEGIRVLASTDGEIEGATELAFISRNYTVTNGVIPAETASDWYTYELPIGFSGTCYIILRGESRYGSSTYMDNFAVKQMPSCMKPSAFECTATTSTSATFGWTNSAADQTAWQICLNGDETNLIMANSNPFTIEDLTAATSYTAKVRAYCDEDNQSDWSNEVSFATLCEAISTFPWTENFNSLTAGIPVCWDNSEGTTTALNYMWNYYASGHEGAGLRFNSYNNSNGLTNFLKTVSLSLPSDQLMQLSFWYKNPTGGDFSVYISTDGGATHETALATGLTGVSTWTEHVISLADYAGQEVVIVFKGTSNYGNGDAYIYLDDVTVMEVPTCLKPNGLEVTAATTTTATLSWTAGANETAWQICLNGDETNLIEANSNPFTIEGLTASTNYAAKVRAYCSADDQSDWSDEVSFATECEAIVVTDSWSEGFEDGDMPVCWRQNGVGTWTVGTGDGNTSTAIGAHTGTYNAKITHSANDNVTKLITPVLDITSLNNATLTFWYINRAWAGDNDVFAVYYRTASDADWTLIEATEEAHETWTEATYTLPEPSATYQIAFEMTDGYGYGVGVDDVTIENAPSYTLNIKGYEDDEIADGYFLIASPVTVDLTNHEMTTGDFDLYYFDQEQDKEWINYKGEDGNFNLEPGKGYLYAKKATTENLTYSFNLTGTPYSGNGEVTLRKITGAQWEGWNLVGNPFNQTAYIDRAFYTMNAAGSELEAVTSSSIEAMEGVFVVATTDRETITFTTEEPNNNKSMLALNLSNGRNVIDRAIVRFGEGSQLPKFQLNPNHTKVYIPQDNKDYAIVNATEMGEMPVSFKAENNGSYILSINAEEVSFAYLHLIDNMTGADVDLLATSSYSFEARTTDYANRFRLVFATGDNSNDDNFAFFSNGSFVINNEGMATVQVIDVNGRILSSESINGCANVSVNAAAGVYMIRLVNGENVKVQKVVVR